MGPNFIKDTDILIKKYLENKCTPEEKNQLLTLLTSYDNEKSSKEALFSHLDEYQEDMSENPWVSFSKVVDTINGESHPSSQQLHFGAGVE